MDPGENTGQLSQCTTANERILSEKEINMLTRQDSKLVSEFRQNKLEAEAQKMWDLFYKRNSTNFFKNRHWTFREFDEIISWNESNKTVLFEAGCGIGNAIFPILEELTNVFIYACDFSPRAIRFVKENSDYAPETCLAFQCDLSTASLLDNIPENSVDIATLIFVLSAIHPDKFSTVLNNISKVLKPGGLLLFRDYGVNDWAMLRFKPGCKISKHFYVRQDGTRAYYFKKEEMATLVTSVGYNIVQNEYVMRETTNRKEDITVPRVFLQGKYRKR